MHSSGNIEYNSALSKQYRMTPRVKGDDDFNFLCYTLTRTEIVTAAIARGQALITVWPNSFPSIVEAENYVSDTLEWKRFRYGVLPDSSYFFKMQVRSRTHYGIVMEAHQKGQFKLAKPPPHRAELRSMLSPSGFVSVTNQRRCYSRGDPRDRGSYQLVPKVIPEHVCCPKLRQEYPKE